MSALEAEGSDAFHKEYQLLKAELAEEGESTSEAGRLPVNDAKNRYADIVPYDFNRCILPEVEGVEGSDYINASKIKGCSGNTSIIAAMGPKKETVADFYRLVWSHNIKVIICLTRAKEEGKDKCFPYWPQQKETFGDFEAVVENESYPNAADGADFCLRLIKVKLGEEERVVRQYHYHTWPDKGVPEYTTPTLQLLDFARQDSPDDSDVPIIIHCSAGCGRTGAFCAIDFFRSKLRKEGLQASVDVREYVKELRRQRPSMVQVQEQYEFIFRAVKELAENLESIGQQKATNVVRESDEEEEKRIAAEAKARRERMLAEQRAKEAKKGGCCVVM